MRIGDKVEHILSKDWLLVVEIIPSESGVIYKCRTKDLKLVELFAFEVVLVK